MPAKKSVNKSLSEAASLMGKVGGKRGGPARALALSKEERAYIASEGGKAKAAKEKATHAHKGKIKKKK